MVNEKPVSALQHCFRRLPARRRAALLLLGGYLLLVLLTNSRAAPGDPTALAVYQRGTLRVAIDPGYRPFADLVDGQPTGFDVELVRLLAAELGLRAEFQSAGFDALYDQLTSGRADLIASALPYAPEQGWRARFTAPYFDAGLMLIGRVGRPPMSADLDSRLRVGVVLGAAADTWARRHATHTDLRRFDDEPALLAAFAAGRLDALVLDRVAALPLLADARYRLVAALSYEPFVFAVPVNAATLERDLNGALERLRARGELTRLEQQWFVAADR
jgi:ABC-type amino acid transport substrate-binding protein